MKQVRILALAVLLSLTLAGCGGGQTQGNTSENEDEAFTQATSDEVVIGGFAIDGPAGREISIPETVAEREDVENYVQTVRPIVEQSALGLFRFIDPSAELQEGRLTLGIEVEPIEEARAEVDDGLAALQLIVPPEDMEPVHELLIAAYVQGVSGYDNIIDAFESGDLEVLTNALQENLPEIEQLTAETRAILQELNRIETVNPDDQAESRG